MSNSAYRDFHRQRKARAIADLLQRIYVAEQHADVVPLSGKPASDETWRIVIRILQDREVGGARADGIPSDRLVMQGTLPTPPAQVAHEKPENVR